MLVAVIADTHLPRGSRRLPDACVERLPSADLIIHAGDFSSMRALEEIEGLGPPLAAVHGNVDELEVRRRLPERRVVEAGGVRIGLIHDAGPARGRLQRLRAMFPDAEAAVFGHSHLPLHEERDGFHIFNPGSPTERRRAPEHTMGLLRAEAGQPAFELVALD
jgi:putative phosphoesterase